jgi:hypothetical protein
MFGFVTKRSLDDALAVIGRQNDQLASLRQDLVRSQDLYYRAAHECNRLRAELTDAKNALTIERNRRQTAESKAERHAAAEAKRERPAVAALPRKTEVAR